MPKNLTPLKFEWFSDSAELVRPKKLSPTSLTWGNFSNLRKMPLNQVECIEMRCLT